MGSIVCRVCVALSGFFSLQRIITRSNCNHSYSLSNSTPDCTRASKRGVTTSFDTPVGDRARRYPKFPYLSMQVVVYAGYGPPNMVRIQRVDVNTKLKNHEQMYRLFASPQVVSQHVYYVWLRRRWCTCTEAGNCCY